MKRRRPERTLEVDDLTIAELLSLEAGWSPPVDGQPRPDESRIGASWTTYLAVWAAVRDALLPEWGTAFAERARCFAKSHGLPALEHGGYDAVRK